MSRQDIEIVFLDIDGTLFVDGHLMDSAIQAVQQLLKRDIPVAICTGRSVLHAKHIQHILQVPYGIYFNGGLVESSTERIYADPFAGDTVKSIIQFADEHDIPTVFHTDNSAVAFSQIPDKYQPILKAFDFPNIAIQNPNNDKVDDLQVFQLNGFMTREWDKTFESRFPECYVYRWDDYGVDFQRRDSDKCIGATQLLNLLGIDKSRALHIGDGGNDIGMFKMVGHSVAMGNAHENIKMHARYITSSVENDGAAKALTALGLI